MAETLVRVEIPEAGVALELPESWTVDIEMEEVSRVDMEDGQLVSTSILIAWLGSADGEAFCGVVMLPRGSITLDEALSTVVPIGDWATLPDGYSTDVVQTTDGEAVQVTFSETREDLGRTFLNAVYLIPSDDGLYSLQCAVPLDSVSEPDDDWLSIAETFEFLPTEA